MICKNCILGTKNTNVVLSLDNFKRNKYFKATNLPNYVRWLKHDVTYMIKVPVL